LQTEFFEEDFTPLHQKRNLILEKNERVPFHWPLGRDEEKKFAIQVAIVQEGVEWQYSPPFPIHEVGVLTTYNRTFNSDSQHEFLIRVNLRLHQGQIFVVFQEEDLEHPLYSIQNQSKFVSLTYEQENDSRVNKLDLLSNKAFAPDKTKPPNLMIGFIEGDLKEESKALENACISVNFNILDQKFIKKLKFSTSVEYSVEIAVLTDGHTKVVRVSDYQELVFVKVLDLVDEYTDKTVVKNVIELMVIHIRSLLIHC
jgi:hypothetical protein